MDELINRTTIESKFANMIGGFLWKEKWPNSSSPFLFFSAKSHGPTTRGIYKTKGRTREFREGECEGEGREMEKSTARDFSRAEPSLFFVRDPNDNDNMEKSGQIHRCSPLVTGERGREKGCKYKGCNAKETTAASIVIGNHPRAAVKWEPTKSNPQPHNPSLPSSLSFHRSRRNSLANLSNLIFSSPLLLFIFAFPR